MSDAPHDEMDESAGPSDGTRDDALPSETLAALCAAWTGLRTPAPTRALADEDEATRRAVGWLAAAWRTPEVLALREGLAAHAARAPLALRVAQRRLASRSDARPGDASRADAMCADAMRADASRADAMCPDATGTAATGPDARRPLPQLIGWRRQVAAAAVLIALLGAALLCRDVFEPDPLRPQPGAPGPIAAADPPQPVAPVAPVAPDASVASAASAAPVAQDAPDTPEVARDDRLSVTPRVGPPDALPAGLQPAPQRAPLVAAGNPPPIELRAGRTRVLLFTDATRRTQENHP